MSELQDLGSGSFRLGKDLVTTTVPGLWAQSKKLFPSTQSDLICIDVSEVTQVDSGGLALLVAWSRWASCHEKQFSLQEIPEKLRLLIENNGLEKLFYS